MSVPTELDHIVIAGPDLAALVDWFAGLTGVHAVPGGAHPTGSANALIALTVDGRRGPQYIELIGPDPTAAVIPTKFGIDRLTGPTVVTYAVHPPELDAVLARARERGYDAGEAEDLSRRTPDGRLLEWRLSRSDLAGPEVPFLIDWGETAQPGLAPLGGRDLPTCELVSFERVEPDPGPTRAALDALGLLPDGAAPVVTGDPARYRLTLGGADGRIVSL